MRTSIAALLLWTLASQAADAPRQAKPAPKKSKPAATAPQTSTKNDGTPPKKGSLTEGILNKLLAPGPLIEGHSDLEKTDCLKCHTPREGIPDAKCMECHKPILQQVKKKSGFHGLAKQTCIECHSDHKGRGFDTTTVDQKTFDHGLTGYKLQGKHAALECKECHTEKRSEADLKVRPDDIRYLGKQSTCVSCHKKDDPHKYTGEWAKKDCNTCHGDLSWKQDIKFDHAKDAKYKLEGNHAKISCAECHTPKGGRPIYKWPQLKKQQCLACHKDQHGTHLSPRFRGGKCQECHDQNHWKIKSFNHDVTDYPLKGAHAKQDCAACHKQSSTSVRVEQPAFRFTGLRKDCLACHKDHHLFGRHSSRGFPRPNKCETCHDERRWQSLHGFDHNQNTRYPIGGKHVGLKCEQCHTVAPRSAPPSRIYQWAKLPTKTCEVCHASPHLKTFSPKLLAKRCTECHVDTGWKDQRRDKAGGFDHSITRFPLTGKHAGLKCQDCHGTGKKQVFKFSHPERGFCIDCHKTPHVGQFSRKFNDKSCNDCHTTATFRDRKPFDHDETRFEIDGAHEKLDCAKCHAAGKQPLVHKNVKPGRFKGKFLFPEAASRQFCVGCHQNVHVNQFHKGFSDQACAECHTTTDFTRRKAFDHSETLFPIRGKHKELACAKCHAATPASFPPPSKSRMSRFVFPGLTTRDCNTCHKDHHEGKFGTKCSECHNENGWKATQDFHKNFTLTGVHFSLECAQCHVEGRRLGGQSNNCKLCHQKDDIHNGTLPNCGTCHRQHFWEQSRFNHSLTLFPLRGVHRTLDCYSCHSTGIYKGIPNQCVNCHLGNAVGVADPPHVPVLIQRDCAECHNQFSFQ